MRMRAAPCILLATPANDPFSVTVPNDPSAFDPAASDAPAHEPRIDETSPGGSASMSHDTADENAHSEGAANESATAAGAPIAAIDDALVDIDAESADLVVEDEPLQPDWQALPPRAQTVFRYVGLFSTCMPTVVMSMVLYSRFGAHATTWIAIGGAFATAIALGLWLAYRRYRYTFWKLDRDGFAVKRGRLWQWETRVPTTRVQHMDLKRGPLERMHGLASVILHTAGTRLSAISVSGMELHDAERLRDYLTRQIDRQDGDEPDHA